MYYRVAIKPVSFIIDTYYKERIMTMITNKKISKYIRYASLLLASYVFIIWVNYELPTSEAIQIANNDNLTYKEQFSAMSALAYKDKQDSQAFYLLYSMLYYGYGTPTSPDAALVMLEKSANAGYGPAQEELAFIYLNGTEHYKKDLNLSYHWLKKAAISGMDKGCIPASDKLFSPE
ncbi:MAG: TPR repeat protein [Colwellia sp.]|jgi:TPR repeat protein